MSDNGMDKRYHLSITTFNDVRHTTPCGDTDNLKYAFKRAHATAKEFSEYTLQVGLVEVYDCKERRIVYVVFFDADTEIGSIVSSMKEDDK